MHFVAGWSCKEFIAVAVVLKYIIPYVYSLAFDCYDTKEECGQWASEGLCHRKFWKHFMKKQCPQSCGHCQSKYFKFGE